MSNPGVAAETCFINAGGWEQSAAFMCKGQIIYPTGGIQHARHINSETMRATNLQVIFDYIRRNEPASRRDIAEFGGLTVAAVSNITSKLLANGLVVEVGAGESVGGRRPTLLGINADCRYAVGIDLTTKQMKLVITNFKAQIIYECARETPLDRGPDVVLAEMAHMIKTSIQAIGIDPQKVIGVGIVSAGPCDRSAGSCKARPISRIGGMFPSAIPYRSKPATRPSSIKIPSGRLWRNIGLGRRTGGRSAFGLPD